MSSPPKLKLIISAVLLLLGSNLITYEWAAARSEEATSSTLTFMTLHYVQKEDPSAVEMVKESLSKASFGMIVRRGKGLIRSNFVLPGLFLILTGLLLPLVSRHRASPAITQPPDSVA